MRILLIIFIGGVAGWLAGKVTKGKGFGFWGNVAIGILGSLIGGFLFRFFGLLAYGLLGHLLMAFLGAVVLLWLVRLLKNL